MPIRTPRTARSTKSTKNSATQAGTAAVLKMPFARIEDKIAARAYEYFLERGGAHGSDVEDWLRAERELSAHA